MKKLANGVKWLIPFLLLLVSCSVGGRHTSDMLLERNFIEHESQFEKLRVEIEMDKGLEMINHDTLRYKGRTYSIENDNTDFTDIERSGFSRERWNTYKHYLEDLHLEQMSGSEKSYIEFRIDKGTLINGDSYKGYAYSPTPPKLQKASLDGYRISDNDKDYLGNYLVYKKIKGNWYLLLFVNG